MLEEIETFGFNQNRNAICYEDDLESRNLFWKLKMPDVLFKIQFTVTMI